MISSIGELRTRLAAARAAARPTVAPDAPAASPTVALVSTLGALHAGHTELIREAREAADIVVVSTFVSPLRFRSDEDAAAYPRTPEVDAQLLAELGVDIVFAPTASEMFPRGRATTKISAGDLGLRYEGRVRPYYFDGLLTTEALLFHLVEPDVVVYGDRDRQRAFLVRRMVRDLAFGIDVRTVPIVREDDELPVSSRTALLEPADRAAAAKLPRALEAAASNADRSVDACIAAAQATLMGEPRIRLEYLNVVDPSTFLPVDEGFTGPAIALIAATVGGHRFIDNADILLV